MKLKTGNWIKIAISLIVLVLVVANAGADDLLDRLRGVDWGWFGLAIAIHLLGVGIRAYRWWLLIAALGAPVSFGRLVYLYLVGGFFSTFLPTGIGGDVVKIIELAPDRGGAKAFSTVFADRLTGLLGSALIALAVAIVDPADVPAGVRAIVVLLSGGILVAALMLTQGRVLDRLFERSRFFQSLPGAGRLRRLTVALTSYSVGAIARSTLVSLPFTAALIATQVALAVSIGLNLDVRYFILFTPIIALTQVLPISFNGLGIREGAFGMLFESVGDENRNGVAVSLLYYAVRVIVGLFGGALYVVGNLRGSNQRISEPAKPPATNG